MLELNLAGAPGTTLSATSPPPHTKNCNTPLHSVFCSMYCIILATFQPITTHCVEGCHGFGDHVMDLKKQRQRRGRGGGEESAAPIRPQLWQRISGTNKAAAVAKNQRQRRGRSSVEETVAPIRPQLWRSIGGSKEVAALAKKQRQQTGRSGGEEAAAE